MSGALPPLPNTPPWRGDQSTGTTLGSPLLECLLVIHYGTRQVHAQIAAVLFSIS
jgi:hypothetical protein